jgi:hypothetical protein
VELGTDVGELKDVDMTLLLFAKRWLLLSAMILSGLFIVQHVRHRPISRENLLLLLIVSVCVAAFPTENKAVKRLGFKLGQKFKG